MRLFLAVPLTAELHRRLEQEKVRLQPRLPEMRWVRSGTQHLTLVFLGEVAEGQVEALSTSARTACRDVVQGRMVLRGLGCFPERGRVRVLWVGVEDVQGTLQELRRALMESVRGLGLAQPEGPFHPHLTLGRARRGLPRAAVRRVVEESHELDLGEMPVSDCVLFRSTLGSGGARHETLQRFALAPGSPCT